MKTSKRILVILISLFIVSLIAASLAAGLQFFLSYPFWNIFYSLVGLQLILPKISDFFYEKWVLKKALDEYNSKPYKQYAIDTACQHCGSVATMNLDLDDTEYQCGNCQKRNAVHVTFLTAAVQTPVNTTL